MLRRFLLTALLYPAAVTAVVTVAIVAAPGMAQRPDPGIAGSVHAAGRDPGSSCPALQAAPAASCPVVAAAIAGCPGARAAIAAASRGRCPAPGRGGGGDREVGTPGSCPFVEPPSGIGTFPRVASRLTGTGEAASGLPLAGLRPASSVRPS